MKIGIVGGGSIGLLFAFYLNQYHEIVLYVRTLEQQKKLMSEGLILYMDQKIYKANVDVRLVSDWGKNDEGLSIICVKQYQLPNLLQNTLLSEQHPLLFIQNGMGHLKWLEQQNADLILVASVEHGSCRMDANSVSHTGKGMTRVAVYKGRGEELIRRLTEPLTTVFPFHVEINYHKMLLRKLVVNSIINPLTAVLKVQNGILLENPFYFQVFNQLFDEIKEILQLENPESYYENVINVCKNTGQNRSSMLRDLEEGRHTEVDAILGYLLEKAHEKQMKAPLVATFYNCIKGSEVKGGGK